MNHSVGHYGLIAYGPGAYKGIIRCYSEFAKFNGIGVGKALFTDHFTGVEFIQLLIFDKGVKLRGLL